MVPDAVRKEILAKVREFYALGHGGQPFEPGKSRIPYAGRVYDEREMQAMVDAVLDFWLTLGPYGEEFEGKLKSFLGVSNVILVNSGSSANLLAVSILCSKEIENHLRPGDEVITPAVTFPTTVAPLIQWLEEVHIQTRLLFAGNILRHPGYCDIAHRIAGVLTNSDLVMRNSFFVGVYPGLRDEHTDYVLERFRAFFSRF